MKTVSIIVVNYNCHSEVDALILSVLNQDFKNYELIIVDNNSPEKDILSLQSKYSQFKFIFLEENIGFAGANNIGIRESVGDYVFLLNADTLLQKNSIEELVNVLKENSKAAAVSPKLIYYNEQLIQYAGSTELSSITVKNSHRGNRESNLEKYNDVEVTAFNHGAAMLVRRSAIEKVGLMPEDYFLYYEELDWCTSFKNNGYQLLYTGRTFVEHKASASTGKIQGLKSYYLTRNRVLYVQKKYPFGLKKVLALSYLFCIVFPKNVIVNIKSFNTLKALTKALIWNIKYLFKTNLKLN